MLLVNVFSELTIRYWITSWGASEDCENFHSILIPRLLAKENKPENWTLWIYMVLWLNNNHVRNTAKCVLNSKLGIYPMIWHFDSVWCAWKNYSVNKKKNKTNQNHDYDCKWEKLPQPFGYCFTACLFRSLNFDASNVSGYCRLEEIAPVEGGGGWGGELGWGIVLLSLSFPTPPPKGGWIWDLAARGRKEVKSEAL